MTLPPTEHEEHDMDLLLWRHAEAEEGSPDDTRRLTERGHHQAETMARWLAEHAPKDLRIVVSPATRTQQTIGAWTPHFETTVAVGTSATADDLLAAVGWPDAGGAVLVVGHQPTLGEVAARLLQGDEAGGLSVRKGALWWLRRRERDGVGETVLRTALSPEML